MTICRLTAGSSGRNVAATYDGPLIKAASEA